MAKSRQKLHLKDMVLTVRRMNAINVGPRHAVRLKPFAVGPTESPALSPV